MISSLHLWRLRFFALLLSFLFTLLVTISIPSVQLPVVRVTLSNDGTSVNEMRVRLLFVIVFKFVDSSRFRSLARGKLIEVVEYSLLRSVMIYASRSYCLHRRDFDNDPCDTFSPCTNEDRRRICSSPSTFH